jgi:hypothetical protein
VVAWNGDSGSACNAGVGGASDPRENISSCCCGDSGCGGSDDDDDNGDNVTRAITRHFRNDVASATTHCFKVNSAVALAATHHFHNDISLATTHRFQVDSDVTCAATR